MRPCLVTLYMVLFGRSPKRQPKNTQAGKLCSFRFLVVYALQAERVCVLLILILLFENIVK